MEKELLEKLISENLSTREISERIGKGKTTVRHWLKKYDLKTNHNQFVEKEYGEYRFCPRCKRECLTINFYQRRGKPNSSVYCKICTNEQTVERTRKFKIKCVEYKGGVCVECGYDSYYGALEFHHLNPEEKDFEISKLKCLTFDKKVTNELDKCILLCNRCHREVEGGVRVLKISEKNPQDQNTKM
jgi:DNA-binding transcriptional ArsR family regulator